jgi:hypothetical protein
VVAGDFAVLVILEVLAMALVDLGMLQWVLRVLCDEATEATLKA